MLGIIYLFICFLFGKELISPFMKCSGGESAPVQNRVWLLLPASFGVGVLVMGWAVYLASWMLSVCLGSRRPLTAGNLMTMIPAVLFLTALYIRRYRAGRQVSDMDRMVCDRRLLRREAVFFGVLFLFCLWIMFYVFHMKAGVLYSGFSVYGDYAPHTAMMRSFSMGNNFPTQYPHFGGEDVKYHFMFQFFTGNLEYLGLRIDIAYNLLSALSLTGFLMMLYQLAVRIMGYFADGVLAVVLFFFRSAFTFFRFVCEHIQAGDLLQVLKENTAFIGYTPNENWGLWNFNVYLNQRHLAFGLLLVCVAIWMFMEYLEAGAAHEEQGLTWIKGRLLSGEAWRSRSLDTALTAGLLLGLCAFWNGAAVIAGLLVLCGMAAFSDGKLDYVIVALDAVAFSFLQTKIFIQGKGLGISFYWGFLAEDKSISGVLWYALSMSGVFFLGLIVLVFFFRRRQRLIMVAFLFPAVFAFVASLTPDIAVNHKYIMISYALLTMFWADVICRLFRRGAFCRGAAVLLALCLTITGLYDFVVILKNNDSRHRVTVNMESSLTGWLAENLDKDDLILTPEYSMCEVTMAGVMLYCGWPYYAWSAGYDTYYRAEQAVKIYTQADAELVSEVVSREGITYILFEEGMEFEEQVCREDVIAGLYPLVFRSDDGRIRIYET